MSQKAYQSTRSDPAQDVVHLLSFDVEEYFQVESAAATVPQRMWCSYEKRLQPAVELLLEMLAEFHASATFFVLGWVARNERKVVARISDAGHEIASHGMRHRMIRHLTPKEFRQDILESRSVLEEIACKPVVGYRAPTFSITHQTAWALDVLAEAGFVYDSSIFPVHHDRYGVPDAPQFAHRAAGPGGASLLEIPPLTLRSAGVCWPVGGGGYLRLLPVRLVAGALMTAQCKGRSGMLYLHPWELDPDQPALPMSPLCRLRHRVGLKRSKEKLRWLLQRFRFADVRRRFGWLLSQSRLDYAYGRPT